MNVVFATVVYEQAWKWWTEFATSLNNQSYKKFDVLIINDGLSPDKLELLKSVIENPICFVEIEKKMTISEIRIKLLSEAKSRGYDLLILGDFDDTFANNRVEKIVGAWKKDVGFYYHNLYSEESQEEVFLSLPMRADSPEQLLEANFLGLSNTALNLLVFEEDFFETLENVTTNIFDWYLYMKILLYGKHGILVRNTYTVYRQQENNLAGFANDDRESILKEIRVKKEQYRLLQKDLDIAAELLKKIAILETAGEKEWTLYLNKDLKGYWWNNIKIL